MRNRHLVIKIVSLLAVSLFILEVNAQLYEVEINSLGLEAYMEEWESKGKVNFQQEGVNITVEETLTKVLVTFSEVYGRDVHLKFVVPTYVIPASVMSDIKTSNNVSVDWKVRDNNTIMSFELRAFQTVTLTLSKASLVLGRVKKGVHNFWSYVEYTGDSTGIESDIVISVSKMEESFEVDNKHMIVQYKTSFFGWYYPVEDVSSDQVYYYVSDLDTHYKVVTHFKGDSSADVKIHVFPGASKGINMDSVKGTLARVWISCQIGIKKILIDVFGDRTPNPGE